MASNSVARPLVTVYGVLIGLLFIAVLIGTLAVRDLREPLRMATESGLETSVAGRELRSALDSLEETVTTRVGRARPDISTFHARADAQRSEFLTQGDRLLASAAAGPSLEALRAELPLVATEIDEITAIERALSESNLALLDLGGKAQSAANDAISMTREHASLYFDSSPTQTRRLADIRFNLSALNLHTQTAINPNNPSALHDAEGLFASQLRRAVYQVSVMPAYERKAQLSRALSTLFELGRGKNNLFGHAKRTAALEIELAEQLGVFRGHCLQVQATARAIAGANDAATESTLRAAQRGLHRYQLALIIASLLTALLGYYVLRRYVYEAVVLRLRRLSATTLRLSHGDLAASVDSDGHDEISDVNLALEIFRQNALDLAISEKALAKRTVELEEVNRELDDFAYVASHDLRAPLHGVDSLASFVQEDLADTIPEESARHLELMRARIKRLHGLLDSLLEFSRIGRQESRTEDVDLDDLVRESASLVEKRGFEFEFDLNVGQVSILATPFQQVVRNLVDNAIKHHDQPEGHIAIRSRLENNVVVLEVADDGPGIPTEFHERVFGMFQTLKARDSVEGSGMGLTFLRKTIHHSGGTIFIESDPSKARGTVFRVRWPLTLPDAS